MYVIVEFDVGLNVPFVGGGSECGTSENMSIKELQTVYHGFIRPTGEFACDGLPFLELRLCCRSAFHVYMCLSLPWLDFQRHGT